MDSIATNDLANDARKAGERVGLTGDTIVIRGGKPLRGTVDVRGAKNLATKAMVAALLGETPSILQDVPAISDVQIVSRMLEAYGVAVTSPEDGVLVLDPVNVARAHFAEIDALAGSSRLGWWPTRGRIRWGTTNPTNPMTPLTAVQAPTLIAVPETTRNRTRFRSTPRLSAASSPRLNASRARALVANSSQPVKMKGVANQTCVMLRSVIDPSNQKTISNEAKGLSDRLSARDVNAPHRLEIATPARMSVRTLPAPARACSNRTATKAPPIAISGRARGNASESPV